MKLHDLFESDFLSYFLEEGAALPKLEHLVRRAFSKVEEMDIFTGNVYDLTTIEVDDNDTSMCTITLGSDEDTPVEEAVKIAPLLAKAITQLIRISQLKIDQTGNSVMIRVRSPSIAALQRHSTSIRNHMDKEAQKVDPDRLKQAVDQRNAARRAAQQNDLEHAA